MTLTKLSSNIFILSIFSYSSAVLSGEEKSSVNKVGSMAKDPMSSGMLGDVTIVLVGILMLIGLMFLLMKRFGRFNQVSGSDVKVIGGVSVGQRERIIQLDIKGQLVVVGVTAHCINTLFTEGAKGSSNSTNTDEGDLNSDKNDFSHQLDSAINNGDTK